MCESITSIWQALFTRKYRKSKRRWRNYDELRLFSAGRLVKIRLTGETLSVTELTQPHIDRCYQLMCFHYDNVVYERFINDLTDKLWIILLKDEQDRIQGFSTQTLTELNVDTVSVKGVFSGDTIIHRDYWGDLELAKIWGRFVFSLLAEYPGHEFYWFLISKGYKTYKFLPAYFKTFFPCYNLATPEFEKKLIDTFGLMRFPETYNPVTGVVYMNGAGDYLKPDIADITQQRLKDPHVAFFVKQNPGYLHGDELVCAAKISKENMRPIVHRYFLKGNY